FLLKYFFQHHRMEKAQSSGTETAEAERPAARKPEGRREREGRDGREREERGPRRERRDRPERPRRSDTPIDGDAIANPPPGPDSRSDEASSETNTEHGGRRAKLWVNLGTTDGLDAAAVKSALLSLSGVDEA